MKKYRHALLTEIKLQDGVLAPRITAARENTIPASLKQCEKTGRFDAFRLNWKSEMPNRPHFFWDSDVAKVLEGIAYLLGGHPDSELENYYDELVDLIAEAQQPDGYLNTYFTVVEPEKRWKNIYNCHELYCAGHLIEAAVAGYEILGKRKLLAVMCRYADYIDSVFGKEDGKIHGYPGHEEIELALMRLYHATGNKRYWRLAQYFIDERGQEPNFFVKEDHFQDYGPVYGLLNRQAHKPVREQENADGHAVRALYLYCGMADVAAEAGDGELLKTCKRLFRSIAERRMYITGGVGSTFQGETFTIDYDLTNGSLMYAESCAAIALVFFCSRMLQITGDVRYADVMERALFNGVLSGISLDGKRFFYTNYLEVDANTVCYNAGSKIRKEWFDCSCCPTNFCRFIPLTATYLWTLNEREYRLEIPVAHEADFGDAAFEVNSNYPYSGDVSLTIKQSGKFKIALRIPKWCKTYSFPENGIVENGYWMAERNWKVGDRLEYSLDMPIEFVRSNFKVTCNAGRIALQRGPLVYCCESFDNGMDIANLVLRLRLPLKLEPADGLPPGTLAICGMAWHESAPDSQSLYYTGMPKRKSVPFTAIPYALWQNRDANPTRIAMAVWMRAEN